MRKIVINAGSKGFWKILDVILMKWNINPPLQAVLLLWISTLCSKNVL